MEQAGQGGMEDVKLEIKEWDLVRTFQDEEEAKEFLATHNDILEKNCKSFTNSPCFETTMIKGEHLYYIFSRVE